MLIFIPQRAFIPEIIPTVSWLTMLPKCHVLCSRKAIVFFRLGEVVCFVFFLTLFFLNFIYLFIYLWLCWVFISVRGLSLVAASGGHSSSRCAGLSLSRPLLLQSTGSRRADSVIVAHGPSCSAACGIFPDQGSNPCALHWQADSQPLRHQGSPFLTLLNTSLIFVTTRAHHQPRTQLLQSRCSSKDKKSRRPFFCSLISPCEILQ